MVHETFGTAFVLSKRHEQTLPATRKARTMFFKTKRNRRKETRQTLSSEQLEPKAMFSVSPVEPVVALDFGPVNQAGYDCTNAGTCIADVIWTNGGASTLRIGETAGPRGGVVHDWCQFTSTSKPSSKFNW